MYALSQHMHTCARMHQPQITKRLNSLLLLSYLLPWHRQNYHSYPRCWQNEGQIVKTFHSCIAEAHFSMHTDKAPAATLHRSTCLIAQCLLPLTKSTHHQIHVCLAKSATVSTTAWELVKCFRTQGMFPCILQQSAFTKYKMSCLLSPQL